MARVLDLGSEFMAEYSWSFIKKLRVIYHTWRAERLFAKYEHMHKEMSELFKKAKEHSKKAEKILEEVKW